MTALEAEIEETIDRLFGRWFTDVADRNGIARVEENRVAVLHAAFRAGCVEMLKYLKSESTVSS